MKNKFFKQHQYLDGEAPSFRQTETVTKAVLQKGMVINMKRDRQVKRIAFEEQTPRLYLPREEAEHLYEKAFWTAAEKDEGEYCRNTTTWD